VADLARMDESERDPRLRIEKHRILITVTIVATRFSKREREVADAR
jgi:hypothetical protein